MDGQQSKPDYSDSVITWFAILEIARRNNDFEQAAKARQELKRLGVNVNYDMQKETCLAS